MATTVRLPAIETRLTGNSRGFSDAAKKAARATRDLERRQYKLRQQMRRATSAAKGLIAPLAALASAAGAVRLTQFVSNTAKAAAELENYAHSIGLSVEAIQALQRAGGDWNIEANVINSSMTKFSRAIGEANIGIATYKRSFDQLGISIHDAEGNIRPTEILFAEFAAELNNLGSAAQRNQILMTVFGRAGARFGLLMREVGTKGLEKFIEGQRQAGILTTAQVSRMQELNRQFNNLGDIMTYHRRVLAEGVTPEWTRMLTAIQEATPAIANILEPALRGISSIAASVVEGLAGMATGLNDILIKLKILQASAEERALSSAKALARVLQVNLKAGLSASDIPSITEDFVESVTRLIENDYQIPMEVRLVIDRAGLNSRLFGSLGQGAGDIQEMQVGASRSSIAALGQTQRLLESVRRTAQEAQSITERAFQRSEGSMWRGITSGPLYDEMQAQIKSAAEAAADRWEEVFRHQIETGRAMFQSAAPSVSPILSNAERAAQARFDREMREMATAPLNEFGGVGPNVITDAQLEKAAKYKLEVDRIDKAFVQLSDSTRDRLQPVFAGLDSQLNNFFTSIIDGTAKASDAFKALAADIARAVLQAMVIQPIASAISGGIGSFFNIPVPGRASGGPVAARSPYVVGERGPELFVPQTSGRIIPNTHMGGNSFSWNVNIQSTDGPGVRKALAQARPLFQQDAIEAVSNAARRPGGLRG